MALVWDSGRVTVEEPGEFIGGVSVVVFGVQFPRNRSRWEKPDGGGVSWSPQAKSPTPTVVETLARERVLRE